MHLAHRVSANVVNNQTACLGCALPVRKISEHLLHGLNRSRIHAPDADRLLHQRTAPLSRAPACHDTCAHVRRCQWRIARSSCGLHSGMWKEHWPILCQFESGERQCHHRDMGIKCAGALTPYLGSMAVRLLDVNLPSMPLP